MCSEHKTFDLPSQAEQVVAALNSVLRSKELAWMQPSEVGNRARQVESVKFLGKTRYVRLKSKSEKMCEQLAIYRDECSDFNFGIECPIIGENEKAARPECGPDTEHFDRGEHLGLYGGLGAPEVRYVVSGGIVIFTLAFRHHKIVNNVITSELDPAKDDYRLEMECPSMAEVTYR